MSSVAPPRTRRPYVYVAAGVLLGLAYAVLNTMTDVWAKTEWARVGWARTFLAFHSFVDRGIPLIAGALLGLALHWLHLRSQLARAERGRADELRSRLRHVERDQAVWVVAASTLHELKNPLHAMGLLVDELEEVTRAGDAEAVADQVARVRKQMDRALVPLATLRSLTVREHRDEKTRPVGAAAAEIVASLRPLAREQGVDLRLAGDLDAKAPVDADRVRVIVDNLVANALEGAPDAGRPRTIEVRVVDEPSHGRVILRVSDDGPGIPEAQRTTMFEPFWTEKAHGLGLGLPIARALARTLGGNLAARDVDGFATTFELTVPVRAEAR